MHSLHIQHSFEYTVNVPTNIFCMIVMHQSEVAKADHFQGSEILTSLLEYKYQKVESVASSDEDIVTEC